MITELFTFRTGEFREVMISLLAAATFDVDVVVVARRHTMPKIPGEVDISSNSLAVFIVRRVQRFFFFLGTPEIISHILPGATYRHR